VRVVRDFRDGQPTGAVFVEFADAATAAKACSMSLKCPSSGAAIKVCILQVKDGFLFFLCFRGHRSQSTLNVLEMSLLWHCNQGMHQNLPGEKKGAQLPN
jgi:hypothetical protein